jgi:hypothetical protein
MFTCVILDQRVAYKICILAIFLNCKVIGLACNVGRNPTFAAQIDAEDIDEGNILLESNSAEATMEAEILKTQLLQSLLEMILVHLMLLPYAMYCRTETTWRSWRQVLRM